MQPLRGIVVVAVEQAVAAPICTRHLGDLGARVIKVENLAGGDFARDYDDVVHGMSAYFAWANRNKESVALDLKQPLGRQALQRLAERADVHTEPVLRELGFSSGDLAVMRAEGVIGQASAADSGS